MNASHKKWLILPLALVFVLAACGENGDDENGDSLSIDTLEILDRGDDHNSIADFHENHWHGSIPLVAGGDHISLGARFLDSAEEEIDIDYDRYTFDARIAPGEDEGLIEIESHGDHLYLTPGDDMGNTFVIFELRDHDDVVFETTPFSVLVSDGEHHDFEVHELEIFDRDDGGELADYHDGHWDGSLTVEVGAEIAINPIFLDAHGDELTLGGEYTVNAYYADGAVNSFIDFDAHGDHIDIEGLAEGTTALHFELLHDGHTEWHTTAPVDVIVTTAD